MDYHAAVTMLRQMMAQGILDETDYTELEAVYAEAYRPRFRCNSSGDLHVEPKSVEKKV